MFDAVPSQPVVPLTQSPGYAAALRLLGVTVEEVAFSQQGFRAGHALMQSRWWPMIGWVGLISRGPLWTGMPDAGLLADELRKMKHPVIVNAEGMLPHDLRRAGLIPMLSGASLAQLDLTGGVQERRARMHQKWRNRVVRAETAGVHVQRAELPGDPGHWVLQAETEQRKVKKYKGLPSNVAAAYARANPRMAQVFTAHHKGDRVAAMVFLIHGPTATYHIGHTTDLGRALNAHSLLLTRASDWLSRKGVDTLDLGTIDTVNAPGLARFKLGSGAQVRELGGTWLYSRALAPVVRKRF